MFKRVLIYVALAALILVGADALLTQEVEIVDIAIDMPFRPMGLTVDTQPALWSSLTFGAWDWVHEDVGEYGRVISIDPGNDGGAVALTYVWSNLLDPSGMVADPTAPNIGHFTVNSDPAGFLENGENGNPSTNGFIYAPNSSSPPFVISDFRTTTFNINFNYSPEMGDRTPGTYTGTLTWTLTTI